MPASLLLVVWCERLMLMLVCIPHEMISLHRPILLLGTCVRPPAAAAHDACAHRLKGSSVVAAIALISGYVLYRAACQCMLSCALAPHAVEMGVVLQMYCVPTTCSCICTAFWLPDPTFLLAFDRHSCLHGVSMGRRA